MKEFVRTMLAVIAAIVVLNILGFLFFLFILGSAAVGSSKTVMPRDAVLDINMADINLAEQSTEDMPAFAGAGMDTRTTVGIWDAVKAIEAAAEDSAVKFIFLRPDGASAGTASLEEFRIALEEFRTSGKPIIAFTESPNTASMYLASVADRVYITSYHGGDATFVGMAGSMMFVKDILDKLGVNVQLIRHGKYKSAGEMFIKNSPSPENMEQNKVMIESMWKAVGGAIAKSRGLTFDQLNDMVDNLRLNFPEDFVQCGLADDVMTREELIAKLCEQAMVSDKKDLHLVAFSKYTELKAVSLPGKNNVAIFFADGDIVDGDDQYGKIAADRFVQEIDLLRADKSVKAVVLRVNSPGGSVIASEKIKVALDKLGEEKPVVASYGDYAASGGYWISNGCRKIYTNASTLTGSIGVFSMIPEFSKTMRKLGVNIVSVGSNAHSDMYALNRPFDAAELAYLQASVEDIYERFVGMVAENRGMTVADVDAIAQGRVWAGADAINIGIVDEIGTLSDAVAYAASLAGFDDPSQYKVKTSPAPLGMMQQLMMSFSQDDTPTILTGTPLESMTDILGSLNHDRPTEVYARMPYFIEIR
ncbi:MAG: signal peptide peptidase SppA [Bacteroidales bacterium]|nr:signal peptide peptidase SppA [Bacteroidales bacterium]